MPQCRVAADTLAATTIAKETRPPMWRAKVSGYFSFFWPGANVLASFAPLSFFKSPGELSDLPGPVDGVECPGALDDTPLLPLP